MKSLQESLLDDEDVLIKNTEIDVIAEVKKYIKEHCQKVIKLKILKHNIVNADFIFYKNNITSLKLPFGFKFGEVNKIYCYGCDNLISLEGAPEECEKFDCEHCDNLKTLKGAPKECKKFYCSECLNLTSLKYAPEKCNTFVCTFCNKLKNLKGVPKECEWFNCSNCQNLTSLEGTPEKCDSFYCANCYKLNLSQEEINKYKAIIVHFEFYKL